MDYTIKSGDTLSSIAARNNTTAAALAKANNISNPNKITAGSVLKLSQGNTITPDQLKTPATLNIPTPTPDNFNAAPVVAGVSDQIANSYNTVNAQYNEAIANQAAQAGDINSILNKLSNKASDTQAANEAAGVNSATTELNKYVTQLSELNAQASSLNREAQAIPLILQEKATGQGVTDAGLAPIQASELRKNAIKALSIGQQADIVAAAATGSNMKLQAAKDKATQMVDLIYQPLEAQLAAKKTQYELNKDLLATIDKKRTEALGIALDREKTKLEEEKKNQQDIQTMLVNASSQGVPAATAAKAKLAKTPLEAATILGMYAGDYWGTKAKIAQYNQTLAQTAKIKADTAETYNKMRAASAVTENGSAKPLKVGNAEIVNLNEAITAKNNIASLVQQYKEIIRTTGTQTLFGEAAGKRDSLKASILFATKALEKTGALDKGSTDVIAGNIPDSAFFNTESGQLAKLDSFLKTVTDKTDEYINSYKGTSAEKDPRTSRAYIVDPVKAYAEGAYNAANSQSTPTAIQAGYKF